MSCGSEPSSEEASGGAGQSGTSVVAGRSGGSGGSAPVEGGASGRGGIGGGGAGASSGASEVGGAGGGAGGSGPGEAGASGGGSAGSTGAGGRGGAPGSTPTTVWIAGDSTVQTCNGACPCGWGGELDALFNDQVNVVNRAVGGRSIQTWLREPAVSDQLGASGECTLTSQSYSARWTGMLDASTGMKAGDTLIIQFGINDGSATCPRHVGNTLYATYLEEMAKAAQARGAQPIFVTPTSAIECAGATAVATRGFLMTIKEAGTKNDVPVIDLHQLSIDLYNELGLCPNDGNYGAGKVGQFFCDDHTHFDEAGARQIAEVVTGALKTQGLALGAYVK